MRVTFQAQQEWQERAKLDSDRWAGEPFESLHLLDPPACECQLCLEQSMRFAEGAAWNRPPAHQLSAL